MAVSSGIDDVTTYVFDSGPFIVLFNHYYPGRFPSLWERFAQAVESDRITSTREVFNELEGRGDMLSEWCRANRKVFATPSADELAFVMEIFNVRHFQAMIRRKERLQGRPVADPFVIARARTLLEEGCVVTTEDESPNAAKIPNVCRHFGIDCTNLEGFMEREGWQF